MRIKKQMKKLFSIILLISMIIPNPITSKPIMAAGTNFATATSITEGVAIQDAISTAGNVDYYVFKPSYTGCYTFSTTGTTDTYGLLYNSYETLLKENDNSSNTNFKISYDLVANENYYLKVRHHSSTGTGNYGVIVAKTVKTVYGNAIDINNAKSVLGNNGYTYVLTDAPGFVLPTFTNNDIVLGGPDTTGGVPDVPLNGAIRFDGANRYLTAQALADYLFPKKVYGNTTDINNTRNILGEVGFRYIYTDKAGYVLPTITANDIIIGGPGATGGVPDVALNGAIRLFGANSVATTAAVNNFAISKRVYGTAVDIDNAKIILEDSGYVYIHTEQLGSSNLPVFCANNLIVGSTGAIGGVPEVPLNGATRLAGTDRFLTAQKIADYKFPKKVYGNTVDIENARGILGEVGYNYIYTDKAGYVLPTFTLNDIIIGGTGAVGGVPNVSLHGAIRLAGSNRTETAEAVRNFSSSRRVFGTGIDIANAKKIMGTKGYVYIDTLEAAGKFPVFCPGNIIVGGPGAIGGVPDSVDLNEAVRVYGNNRDLTEQAIYNYAGIKDIKPNCYGKVNRSPSEMMVAVRVDGTSNTISIPKDTQLKIYSSVGDYYDCYYSGTSGIKILKVYLTPVTSVSEPSPAGGYTDFLVMLALHESGSGTNSYGVENPYHYLGRYQMGELALIDANFYYENPLDYVNDYDGSWTSLAKSYGVTGKSTFLNNVNAQECAIRQFHKKQWQYIQYYGLEDYIGQTVRGVKTTASGLLAVTHLVGIGGAINYFDLSKSVPKDGNGTSATIYMKDMGGCDLTSLIGYNPDGEYPPDDGSGNANIDKFISIAYGEVGTYVPENGWNKYGSWYGYNYVAWCAEFVSWCANQAGILNTVVPKYASCTLGKDWYVDKGKFATDSSGYKPKAGDVVFYGPNASYHTGIVVSYDPDTDYIYTIEGNYANSVKILYRRRSSDYVYGYGKNGGTTYGKIPNNAVTASPF